MLEIMSLENIEQIVKRGFLALEDCDWINADIFFEKALNNNAEDSFAYLGKMMAELKADKFETLYKSEVIFEDMSNYKKAIRFADDKLKSELNALNNVVKYNNGIRRMENGKTVADFENCIYLFETLGGWNDTQEMIVQCNRKIEEIKAKELEKEQLNQYKAKKMKKNIIISIPILLICVLLVVVFFTVFIPSQKYKEAVQLYDMNEYELAYLAYRKAGNYKDSEVKANEILKEHPTVARTGDYIIMGSYEQDNNLDNGKENIEWQVLEKDGTRFFVVSKYALDVKSYHSAEEPITWADCSLREWLNTDFLNSAFSSTEQANIIWTQVKNNDNVKYKTNGGSDTEDRVFLLSLDEVNRYFPEEKDRKCIATTYANEDHVSGEECFWWLRTSGFKPVGEYEDFCDSDCAVFIFPHGKIDEMGCPVEDIDDTYVRPAMWVDLE